MSVAILTQDGFERAVVGLLNQAYSQGRGSDVERIVRHVDEANSPQVSQLAALMYLVDEEYRLPLQESIEAFKRWCEKKEQPATDEAVMRILRKVYLETQAGLSEAAK